jgi:hypothetical protein
MKLSEALNRLDEGANKSLARIHSHMQDRNVGILTAHRDSETPEVNKKNNAELQHKIRAHGYGFVHVRGRYVMNKGEANERPVEEHSFMVIGKKGNDNGQLKNFLTKHGEHYGQETILHKAHDSKTAHLIGTKDTSFLKKGEHMDVGEFHPNRAGDYHSALKKGAPRTGDKAYTVIDHEGKENKSFPNRGEANKHLQTGIKAGELKKGSHIRYNPRTFAMESVALWEPAGWVNSEERKI